MAEVLLITMQEVTNTTILGGNIDPDKFKFCIFDAQINIIEPLLGTILYEKVRDEKDTLSGLYLELYTDYVKPILKFSAVSEYIKIAPYMVNNGGIYKHTAENKEVTSLEENSYLAQKYKGQADVFIIRFQKWICDNYIEEYKTYQDKVNATKSIRTNIGWRL